MKMMLKDDTILPKLWYFLSTYVLTLKRFDMFLQGTLLVVVLLETNIYLLLKRDAAEGYHPILIEEWVTLGVAGTEVMFSVAVAWCGRGKRQLALSSWLALTSASGLLVLASPFAESNTWDVELCGNGTISSFFGYTSDRKITIRKVALVLTALLCVLTKISIWSHGITYLDDHDPSNGPYLYGNLISISLTLGLSDNNWLQTNSDDWWKSHLSICMVALIFAVIISLFPARMKNCLEEEDICVDTGLRVSLNRIIRNKALVVQTLSLSFLSAAVFCFVHYDKAYVQARFYVETARSDPRTSRALSDIFRSLVIILYVMIFRVRFSAHRSDGVKARTASRVAGVVAIFVAIFFALIAIIGCDTGDVVGLESGAYQEPSCSNSCGCDSEKYGFSPVCMLDTGTTYFSPCHAGCSQLEDLNGFLLYQNCSCSPDTQRAIQGACSLLSCQFAFSAYQVLYTLMLAVSASCFLMQGMVVIRAVRPADKPIAVGGSFTVVALLSFIFGRLLYMVISYLTCAYTNKDACLLHHSTIWIASATSSVLAVLASITSLVASRMPAATPEPIPEI